MHVSRCRSLKPPLQALKSFSILSFSLRYFISYLVLFMALNFIDVSYKSAIFRCVFAWLCVMCLICSILAQPSRWCRHKDEKHRGTLPYSSYKGILVVKGPQRGVSIVCIAIHHVTQVLPIETLKNLTIISVFCQGVLWWTKTRILFLKINWSWGVTR